MELGAFSFKTSGKVSTSGGTRGKVTARRKPTKPLRSTSSASIRARLSAIRNRAAKVRAAVQPKPKPKPSFKPSVSSSKPKPKPKPALRMASFKPSVSPSKPALRIAAKLRPGSSQVDKTVSRGQIAPSAVTPPKPIQKAITGQVKLDLKKALKSAVVDAKAKLAPPILQKQAEQKAEQYLAPAAEVCNVHPSDMLARLDERMCASGYPTGVAAQLLAQVQKMNEKLNLAATQRMATYEHNKLKSQDAFESAVLERLSRLAGKLPRNHPTRKRAERKCQCQG